MYINRYLHTYVRMYASKYLIMFGIVTLLCIVIAIRTCILIDSTTNSTSLLQYNYHDVLQQPEIEAL